MAMEPFFTFPVLDLRLLPNEDIVAMVCRKPDLICSVTDNRSLSIW